MKSIKSGNVSAKPKKRLRKKQNTSKERVSVAPVARSISIQSGVIPQLQTSAGATRVSHSEWFADVSVGAINQFNCLTYAVNPGVSAIFPWLSRIAQRYETYKFRRFEIKYHAVCSTIISGTFGMVFDFDANDSPPAYTIAALQSADKFSNAPWASGSMSVNLAAGDKMPTRYVRAGVLTTVTDLKTTDLGNLHVFTDTVSQTGVIGRLEACYVVDLFTPQVESDVGGHWSNADGLTTMNLVGNEDSWIGDPSAVAPFVWLTCRWLRFNQSFEGLLTFQVTGTGMVTPLLVNQTTGDATIVGSTGTATNIIAFVALRLPLGSQLSLQISVATTLTSVHWYFATGSYTSFL